MASRSNHLLRTVVGLVLSAYHAAAAAQTPMFSARLEAVRLDVLVTSDGKPVRDLGAADFEVRDKGVLQSLDLVTVEKIPLSVVLTLDVSASVEGERQVHLKDAAGAVLDALRSGDRAALVSFTDAIDETAALTLNLEPVRTALAGIAPAGDTALVDGAYAGITLADTAPGRGLMILFSDGRDTASWLNPDAVLDAGRRSNAVVYAVAARARDTSFLERLTTVTGGRLYELESTRNLRAVFLAALDEFRHRYLVSYTPRGIEKGGWHTVDVRVKRRGVTVRTRPGYLAGS
jgi:Ca-activated chloride channel family protein